MAIYNKPKLVEEPQTRNVVRVMILMCWFSLTASLWLAMFLSIDFFFFGIFWFILTMFLALLLTVKINA